MSKTVVIKYNAGNTRSVLFALERIGVQAVVTDNLNEIRSADRVIFPGVGEASSAMTYLREKGLVDVIRSLKQPVLGICLGMQLMCEFSAENNTSCLNIFPQQVIRFPNSGGMKVPQIGWNNITDLKSELFNGIDAGAFVYFVHGYYVPSCANSIATSNYNGDYSAAIKKDNFYAVQFHPEKSGEIGERVLRNFLFNCDTTK